MRTISRSQALAAILAALGLWIALSAPFGFSADGARAAGLCLAAIGLWATGALPESLTALLFFVVAMLFGIAPGKVVFTGFMSSAFWLIFAGLVFGAAIKSTGLGDRVAHLVGRALGHSYRKALLGVFVMGIGLAFVMPSSLGRIVLLVPLLTALAKHLGYETGSKGWNGLVLGGIMSTFLCAFSILPSNIPNMVLAGAVETQLGITLGYGDYLLSNFPVLGLARLTALYVVLLLIYRGDEPTKMEEPPPGVLSVSERRLALVLVTAILFWITDGLHHISPAWIGLAAAIVCLLPQANILPPRSLSTVNFEPVIYVAGVIGMGAVIEYAGVGKQVGNLLIGALPLGLDQPFWNFMCLAGLALGVGMATTLPGVPAVLTPFANQLAGATGLPVTGILLTQVAGFSTLVLPYQAPPVMTGLQLSQARYWDFARLCLIMAAIGAIVLWPLDFLWLSLIGKL
jgi:anion transporter